MSIRIPMSARALLVAIALLATGALVPASAATGAITEFPVFGPGTIGGIAAGPDGNLWFALTEQNAIGRITTGGVVWQFPVPRANSSPFDIAAGPDGNLWFTERTGNRIGRITPAGAVTEFRIPTPNSPPAKITAGPDGNLWFTVPVHDRIGRITPAGVITQFTVPTAGSNPSAIAAGPDGNLWFTEASANKIGRITPAGAVTEFAIPSPDRSPAIPGGIAAGPDGALWFTELRGNKIGRITTAGVVTAQYPLRWRNSGPFAITTGPDRNLWFTEFDGNRVGRITPRGVITEFPLPTVGAEPLGITAGPDGNLWFTERFGNQVGRLDVTPLADLALAQKASNYHPVVGTPVTFTLTVRNFGPNAAAARVTDPLPGSLTFVSASPGPGGECRTPPAGSSGTVVCTTGMIPAGGRARIRIVARPRLAGPVSTQASVAPLALVAEVLPDNNRTTATVWVRPARAAP